MGADRKGKKDVLELDDPLESGVIPTVIPPEGAVREPVDTFVDDEVTEQARLASVLIDSQPPPPGSDDPRAIRARLSPLDRVPTQAKSIDELPDDLKEPKAVFVLGFIDGVLPLETIIEVTCLPEGDTLRILDRLIAQGAIVFPPRR
jgi:hypothetical protein